MSAWTVGFLVVFGGTFGSVLGILWVRKNFKVSLLESHHEVAGYLLSVIGTLYAVLLGLIVVDVQSKYQQAQVMAETEANAVADLFLLSRSMPPSLGAQMTTEIRSYVDAVVEKEWGTEMKSITLNQGSVFHLRRIWRMITLYEPVTNREQACYSSMLSTMSQLADARRYRVVSTRGGISAVLWGVLIAGGVCTVVFTYFFGVENAVAHVAMTALVSLCLSLNVMLVALFSNPYRGDLKVQPDGFRYDQKMFEAIVKEMPLTEAQPPSLNKQAPALK